ncbi:uncharacterized protein MGAL_10B022855 [Mytilus galloprovincialis]|uniref:Novel STAND NTPase 3 domain-containing protein n=1 Tax=Mytilus galloprovincialis TaxID=29158 RepID=A0A8B6GEA5_MYTGA|nr:uncharacterized protein MGAL_10B022855 [Mytilus galloprovincialis]
MELMDDGSQLSPSDLGQSSESGTTYHHRLYENQSINSIEKITNKPQLKHRPIGLATKNYDKPQLTTRTKNKKQIEHVEQRLYREDPVPEYFRAQISPILKVWRDNDATMFIDTNAAQQVLKCLQENSCVTITATSGVGKTATLRHVALQMSKKDYDVLPVSDPGEIVNFYNPNKKTLFVIDDLCGNYHIDQADIAHWQSIIELIKQILLDTETKMIASCRLQVYHDDKFKTLSVFKSCVCNLLSENMCLSKTEKQLIAELYLKTKASEITGYHDLYEFFPLVCKLFYDNPKLDLLNYFQNPFAVYETEIDSLKKGYDTKYSALALCVMFNNKLKEEILTEKVSDDTMTIITNTYEACTLNKIPSIPELKADLDSLKETFIRKEQNQYMIKHDKIFDFIAYYFGQRIINCLIKNADSALIKERFLLEKQDNIDQFTIVIPPQYHEMYIQRMIDDWSKGKCSDVFSNTNMKVPQFREKFLFHLNTLDMIEQTQLARISERRKAMNTNINDDSYATALVHCCYISDYSLVQWCCNHGVDVNNCSYMGKSPIMIACEQGNSEIVQILLERGADCNIFIDWNQSPVMQAYTHCHIELVKVLLNKWTDYDKCNYWGESPLMMACRNGHTNIVKMLLDRGSDCNKCDNNRKSSLFKASMGGYTEIVKMLLEKGSDCNICNNNGESPLFMASLYGKTEIVKMLLDKGADCNICNNNGESPVFKASLYGKTEIVKMLLDKGADYNICNNTGESLLIMASMYGYTEIVKMLLDKGADCNICNNNGVCSLFTASMNGHTEIVKMLLDKGADCNICNNNGESPLFKASFYEKTEIVKMLLDKGSDCNICNNTGKSPLINASVFGYTEIVKMLLDKGSDYNICYNTGESLLIMASMRGYTEIVKMLLDKGADCNICNNNGESPLFKASMRGYTEIVTMLLDKGADCNS